MHIYITNHVGFQIVSKAVVEVLLYSLCAIDDLMQKTSQYFLPKIYTQQNIYADPVLYERTFAASADLYMHVYIYI